MRDKTILRIAFTVIIMAIFIMEIVPLPFHTTSMPATLNTVMAKKYEFKEVQEICLYSSLDQRVFFIAENSDKKRVKCYLACATEMESEPIGIVKEENSLILEKCDGGKISVPLEKCERGNIVTYAEAVSIDDEISRDSLLEVEPVAD